MMEIIVIKFLTRKLSSDRKSLKDIYIFFPKSFLKSALCLQKQPFSNQTILISFVKLKLILLLLLSWKEIWGSGKESSISLSGWDGIENLSAGLFEIP